MLELGWWGGGSILELGGGGEGPYLSWGVGGGSILELGGGSILELGGGGRVCWSVFSGSKVDVFY